MYYDRELSFLTRILSKMRIHTAIIDPDNTRVEDFDFGLRKFLGTEDDYYRKIADTMSWIDGNTIYKLEDTYYCKYIFMVLPDTKKVEVLIIGPYMLFEMSSRQLMEKAERNNITQQQLRQLEKYYMHIPVLNDEMPLFNMVNVFAENLWGKGKEYDIVDINSDNTPSLVESFYAIGSVTDRDMSLQMKLMETRYEYENQLMDAVTNGLTHRAEKMLSQATGRFLEQRGTNPIRSVKNYCIICNTLMRKAAEKGGVHPLNLDKTSSEFAGKIEAITDFEKSKKLMSEMARAYCRLVRKKSVKQFSQQIQKTVMHIQSDLSGDLSLCVLAAAQNINPSYLSALFKKETGKTVTEYVNEKRIELASQLLRTTNLQIQTVAQYCGMADANYFSRVFKKYKGMTPTVFRDTPFTN